eukprot:751271-Hanusia_phi.AAC.3
MQNVSSHQGNGTEACSLPFSQGFPNAINGSLHSTLPAFPSSAISLSEVESSLGAGGSAEQNVLSWKPSNGALHTEQQRRLARSEALKSLPDTCMRWNHEGKMLECRVELNKYKLVNSNLVWPLQDSDIVEIWPTFVSAMERKISQLDQSKDFIIFVDVSFEENNLGDLSVMTVCQGLLQVLQRPKPNLWLRSLDFAFNFVSDVGCFHISSLIESNLRSGSDQVRLFLADKSNSSQVSAPSITLRLSYNCITSSGASLLAEKLSRYNAKFSSPSKNSAQSALNAKMQIGYNRIDMRMIRPSFMEPRNEKRDEPADIDWGYHTKPRQFVPIDQLHSLLFESCLRKLFKTRKSADVPLLLVPDTTSFLRMMQDVCVKRDDVALVNVADKNILVDAAGEYGKPPDLNINFLPAMSENSAQVMIVMIGSVYRSLWHLVENQSTTQSDRVAILHLLGTCLNKVGSAMQGGEQRRCDALQACDAGKILLVETELNSQSTQKKFEVRGPQPEHGGVLIVVQETSNVSHWKSSPSIVRASRCETNLVVLMSCEGNNP